MQAHSARHTIFGNYFEDVVVGSISTADVTSPASWSYATGHYVGRNHGTTNLTLNLLNLQPLKSYAGGNEWFDRLDMLNGGAINAIRGTGAATLYLDATPQDGTSGATVSVFANTTTTGAKVFNVTGEARATTLRTGGAGGPTWTSGTAAPEGVVAAGLGSFYSNTTTGKWYVKESGGTGNTGWVMK
jgi:hypothetical protein